LATISGREKESILGVFSLIIVSHQSTLFLKKKHITLEQAAAVDDYDIIQTDNYEKRSNHSPDPALHPFLFSGQFHYTSPHLSQEDKR
jgi:hypothetical protein